MDQQMVSIRIAQWIERNNRSTDDPLVYKVSDKGFSRVDRISWDADKLNETSLKKRYDAHLPLKAFLPVRWVKIKPLVHLMHGGNESAVSQWCDEYVQQFNALRPVWQFYCKNYFMIVLDWAAVNGILHTRE